MQAFSRPSKCTKAIDRLQKPVIASVNGFAVGGGNVLQVVCDMTIAKESAVFRQVGPMMGSFDAGYGTWYLEDLRLARKRPRRCGTTTQRFQRREALEIGLINKVVPDDKLRGDAEVRPGGRRPWAVSLSPRSRRLSIARHGGGCPVGASVAHRSVAGATISIRREPRTLVFRSLESASQTPAKFGK